MNLHVEKILSNSLPYLSTFVCFISLTRLYVHLWTLRQRPCGALIQSQPAGARSSVCVLVCNWMILSLAKIWNLSTLKGHPFALGRYVSNSFQSGKKVAIFSSF